MSISTLPAPSAFQQRVLLAGATGLVGGRLLRHLLDDPSVDEVQVLARREVAVRHPKLKVHWVDFHRLPKLPPVDAVYLALGTTIRVAGSRQAFRAVDLDANLSVARAGIEAGARRVALVSAVGADAHSKVFYNQVKGDLEQALAGLPLDALVIAQPSLLLGDRAALKQPLRVGEKLAIGISRALTPLLPAGYRPVEADAVARALVRTLSAAKGRLVLSSSELARVGA